MMTAASAPPAVSLRRDRISMMIGVAAGEPGVGWVPRFACARRRFDPDFMVRMCTPRVSD